MSNNNSTAAPHDHDAIAIVNDGEISDEQYRKFQDKILFSAMDAATSEDVEKFLNSFDKTKHVMAAREYRKLRKRFQLLEIECYIVIYENGWGDELRKFLKPIEFEALQWLCSLNKDERNEVIHRDVLYTTSYRRFKEKEMFEQNIHFKSDRVVAVSEAWAKDRIFEYFSNDKTNITSESLEKALDADGLTYPASIVHNTVDGTKDKLLKAGAIGIGDGQYVSASNEKDIIKGLDKRLDNLVNAFTSFQELSDKLDGNYVITTKHQGSKKLNVKTFIGVSLGMMFAQDGMGKVQLEYTNDYYGTYDMKTFISMVKLFAIATGFASGKNTDDSTFFNAALALKYGSEVKLVRADNHDAVVDGYSIYGPTSHQETAQIATA